jgi:hypothetical protein
MAQRLGDEQDAAPVERWMTGLRVEGVEDFESFGERWRMVDLSNGTTVQMRLCDPWLILEGEHGDQSQQTSHGAQDSGAADPAQAGGGARAAAVEGEPQG